MSLSRPADRSAAGLGEFANRTVVITGASQGIGRACAVAFACAGADLALISRSADSLTEVAEQVHALGGDAQVIPLDVTDLTALEGAVQALERVDVFVQAAGTNIPEPFVQVSEVHFDAIFDLNVKALFFAARASAQRMIASGRGGAIVNIGSQMGHVGDRNRSVYCASKHAVEGLTKALAVELAPSGIRVNCVAPTFVETPLTMPFFSDPQFHSEVVSRIPLGRVGRVEEVAEAVLFLASERASLITGASLLVDGGWTAR